MTVLAGRDACRFEAHVRVCRRVFARRYPQAPTGLTDGDPWTSLLWAGDRVELPGHPQPHWRPHPAALRS